MGDVYLFSHVNNFIKIIMHFNIKDKSSTYYVLPFFFLHLAQVGASC